MANPRVLLAGCVATLVALKCSITIIKGVMRIKPYLEVDTAGRISGVKKGLLGYTPKIHIVVLSAEERL